jgi:hypothetical protein
MVGMTMSRDNLPTLGLLLSMIGLVMVVLSNVVVSETTRLVVVTVAFALFCGGGFVWARTRRSRATDRRT